MPLGPRKEAQLRDHFEHCLWRYKMTDATLVSVFSAPPKSLCLPCYLDQSQVLHQTIDDTTSLICLGGLSAILLFNKT